MASEGQREFSKALETLKELMERASKTSLMEDLISFLEEPENEQILDSELSGIAEEVVDGLLELLLSQIKPGYAYHRRTFELFQLWRTHNILPFKKLELTRLRLGWVYRSAFGHNTRALREEEKRIRQSVLSLLESHPSGDPREIIRVDAVLSSEEESDVTLRAHLEKHVSELPHAEQIRYLQLASEDVRESVNPVGQVIADRLDPVLPPEQDSASVTLLVAGKSGTGKSTLCNCILGIDPNDPKATKEVAGGDRGTQVSQTLVREFISAGRGNKVRVEVIDTPGFELDEKQQVEVQEMIQQRVLQGVRVSDKEHTPITAILYALPASVSRVDLKEQEFIRCLSNFAPVIVVYLKAYSDNLVEGFNRYFDELRVPISIKARIPVYARAEAGGYPPHPRNLHLIARSVVQVYEEAQSQLVRLRSQIASTTEQDMLDKWANANKFIYSATLAAGGVGAIPIPFSDLAALITIQTGLIASINYVYGIPIVGSNVFNTLITTIVGPGSGMLATRCVQLALDVCKALPFLNVVSSVVSAGLAGATTLSLGCLYRTAVDKAIRENPTLLSYDSEQVESLITDSIFECAEKQAKLDTISMWNEVSNQRSTEGMDITPTSSASSSPSNSP